MPDASLSQHRLRTAPQQFQARSLHIWQNRHGSARASTRALVLRPAVAATQSHSPPTAGRRPRSPWPKKQSHLQQARLTHTPNAPMFSGVPLTSTESSGPDHQHAPSARPPISALGFRQDNDI
ncbi:hypothetical protein NDU88_002777 [Pleurodeles waltl]|uniref:Uncharacterized protein n=1 Tax=Pleurodeles waltl TaxID=8319 RepID=A0AAV7SCZ8_PLEWA|nr:hypothetical protein NDU88_002777 [Pleurodeles waltl]